MKKQMMWENDETAGCELAELSVENGEIRIDSTVLFLDEKGPVKTHYQLELDESWATKRLAIKSGDGHALELTSSGEGQWFGQDGQLLEELSGAIDIDISATPFSNSLPINRKSWHEGQTREFEMVYIAVPSLELRKMKQIYTCVTASHPRTFRYQSENFESLIEVDEDGFVIHYPGLFTRIY
ncbi:putative glycolipid-binding domain-containing protein [Planococcus sp. SSTMD024]|uniref:putative glycolipid-binding domain-containing protein n=1 Tax=Planococcus sp. SSTMD024 TaxID=3242163 RepID=UPI00351EFD87